MKNLVIAALLGATAITGGVALQAQNRAAPANGPTYGRFGFDEKGMDKSVRPGDDFYAFANGEWAKTTAIPADKASYGAFDVLADLSRERTHTILEQAKGQRNQIGTAYATYLDTGTIEAKGLSPIKPWLDRIKGLGDKSGYAALLAEADRNGVDIPFGSGVGQDARQPDIYTVGLRQAGLGMPDRDYYLSSDPKLAAARTAYQAHLAKMMTMAGEPDAEARAQAILAFETEIAKVHWTRIDSRDRTKTYNKMSVADLAKMAPGFDFATYLKGVGTPVDTLVVAQPTAVTGIAALIQSTPIAVLKDQLLVRSLDEFAGVLPAQFDREQFAFTAPPCRVRRSSRNAGSARSTSPAARSPTRSARSMSRATSRPRRRRRPTSWSGTC